MYCSSLYTAMLLTALHHIVLLFDNYLHQAREWEQALELWPLVLRAGITPDKRLLGLVITSYIRAGTPEKALRLLDSGI
jgi:hypothetical protein